MPLTVAVYQYADGATGLLTRWTLTQAEREAVSRGEDIYVMQINNGPMTPLIVRAGAGDFTMIP